MKRSNIRHRSFPQKSIGPLLSICLLLIPLAAHTSTPTIKLFPTTVLEEIKHTGNVAAEMETGLQTVISRLDEQQKLYIESKCEGNEGDPGCEQIARQMGKSYLEMLNNMAEKLPEMETAVNSTSTSLEKRIRRELGQKKTSWTLQELLVGAQTDTGSGSNTNNRPTLRGRSGMRLSDRFQQYYKLVARSGGEVNSSLAVVASDIYLDMKDTSNLIARTREEIARATLMEQLNQSFGTITPEMQEVVAGVKFILFGEEQELLPMTAPPASQPELEYDSPLKL
ncbi:MAG: hypothetical protein GY792_29820 [Gammaproteobacteria bacterium]|nr:hypothetical protein [Gammaproteobacteria bacterium]